MTIRQETEPSLGPFFWKPEQSKTASRAQRRVMTGVEGSRLRKPSW